MTLCFPTNCTLNGSWNSEKHFGKVLPTYFYFILCMYDCDHINKNLFFIVKQDWNLQSIARDNGQIGSLTNIWIIAKYWKYNL